MNAHIQGTIAVPLELVPTMYGQLATGSVSALAAEPAKKTLNKMAQAGAMPALSDKSGPSPQLKGFLLVAVDYVVQGFVPLVYRKYAKDQFPKGVFHVLAKTRFDKMLTLVPEYEQLIGKSGGLKDEWINWIVQTALTSLEGKPLTDEELGAARKDLVLNQTFGESDEKPYQVGVTREQWLGTMPKDDLLAEKHDPKHLQGMGAFGGGTDKLVSASEKDTMASSMAKQVVELQQQSSTSSTSSNPDDKGKAPHTRSIRPAEGFASTEAPIFELRKVEIQGGAPSSWMGNVDTLWELHNKVLGELKYEKQKKKH